MKSGKIKKFVIVLTLVISLLAVQTLELTAMASTGTPDLANPSIIVSSFADLQSAVDTASDGTVIGIDATIYISSVNATLGSEDGSKHVYIVRMNADSYIYIIRNQGLTISNITLDGNSSQVTGNNAMLYVEGTLNLNNSTIQNCAGTSSGAVYVTKNAVFNASGTNFNNNSATSGGHVENYGTATLHACNFTNGSASEQGGAISNKRNMTIENCRIVGNHAGLLGGGIQNDDSLSVSQSIIYGNTATYGNDIANTINYTLYSNDDLADVMSLYEAEGISPVEWRYDGPATEDELNQAGIYNANVYIPQSLMKLVLSEEESGGNTDDGSDDTEDGGTSGDDTGTDDGVGDTEDSGNTENPDDTEDPGNMEDPDDTEDGGSTEGGDDTGDSDNQENGDNAEDGGDTEDTGGNTEDGDNTENPDDTDDNTNTEDGGTGDDSGTTDDEDNTDSGDQDSSTDESGDSTDAGNDTVGDTGEDNTQNDGSDDTSDSVSDGNVTNNYDQSSTTTTTEDNSSVSNTTDTYEDKSSTTNTTTTNNYYTYNTPQGSTEQTSGAKVANTTNSTAVAEQKSETVSGNSTSESASVQLPDNLTLDLHGVDVVYEIVDGVPKITISNEKVTEQATVEQIATEATTRTMEQQPLTENAINTASVTADSENTSASINWYEIVKLALLAAILIVVIYKPSAKKGTITAVE